MNVRHSTARFANEYQPTIIESGLLLSRLALQIDFLRTELEHAWLEFQAHPKQFAKQTIHDFFKRSRVIVHAIPATSLPIFVVGLIVTMALLIDGRKTESSAGIDDLTNTEIAMVDLSNQPVSKPEAKPDSRIGKDGKGRVGFNSGRGEGSGATPKLARGGDRK